MILVIGVIGYFGKVVIDFLLKKIIVDNIVVFVCDEVKV